MISPYYQDEYCTIYNADFLEVIPFISDIDLILTDPPYGINENSNKIESRNKYRKGRSSASKSYGEFNWDNKPLEQWKIDMLLGASKYQVIWGGNYYRMPPCKGPLVWDKENGATCFADGEIAWNNYGKALRIKRYLWNGMIKKHPEERFHPTQKPLEVIEWALSLCPEKPSLVVDTFMGSGTTLVAAKKAGIKCIGIDKEKKWCDVTIGRIFEI